MSFIIFRSIFLSRPLTVLVSYKISFVTHHVLFCRPRPKLSFKRYTFIIGTPGYTFENDIQWYLNDKRRETQNSDNVKLLIWIEKKVKVGLDTHKLLLTRAQNSTLSSPTEGSLKLSLRIFSVSFLGLSDIFSSEAYYSLNSANVRFLFYLLVIWT